MANSTFGMLRVAAFAGSLASAPREIWRKALRRAPLDWARDWESQRDDNPRRIVRRWEARGQGITEGEDMVGVAIRFWDALCFERIAGNSESVGVAISRLRENACCGGQGLLFSLFQFHFGKDCDCPRTIAFAPGIREFSQHNFGAGRRRRQWYRGYIPEAFWERHSPEWRFVPRL